MRLCVWVCGVGGLCVGEWVWPRVFGIGLESGIETLPLDESHSNEWPYSVAYV